jgi:hypothetical protein
MRLSSSNLGHYLCSVSSSLTDQAKPLIVASVILEKMAFEPNELAELKEEEEFVVDLMGVKIEKLNVGTLGGWELTVVEKRKWEMA